VPYLETIRKEARARHRYKKQTGGRGDYHMHFLRYEEVPTHIAQKVIAESKKEPEEAKV
jgi:hypothetical protein